MRSTVFGVNIQGLAFLVRHFGSPFARVEIAGPLSTADDMPQLEFGDLDIGLSLPRGISGWVIVKPRLGPHTVLVGEGAAP